MSHFHLSATASELVDWHFGQHRAQVMLAATPTWGSSPLPITGQSSLQSAGCRLILVGNARSIRCPSANRRSFAACDRHHGQPTWTLVPSSLSSPTFPTDASRRWSAPPNTGRCVAAELGLEPVLGPKSRTESSATESRMRSVTVMGPLSARGRTSGRLAGMLWRISELAAPEEEARYRRPTHCRQGCFELRRGHGGGHEAVRRSHRDDLGACASHRLGCYGARVVRRSLRLHSAPRARPMRDSCGGGASRG